MNSKNTLNLVEPFLKNKLLLKAAEEGNLTFIRHLLKVGADPNYRNYQGATPIMLLSRYNPTTQISAEDEEEDSDQIRKNDAYNKRILEILEGLDLLYASGGSIYGLNDQKQSALFYASCNPDERPLLWLLKNGTNFEIDERDVNGDTCLHERKGVKELYKDPSCEATRVLLIFGASKTITNNDGHKPVIYYLEDNEDLHLVENDCHMYMHTESIKFLSKKIVPLEGSEIFSDFELSLKKEADFMKNVKLNPSCNLYDVLYMNRGKILHVIDNINLKQSLFELDGWYSKVLPRLGVYVDAKIFNAKKRQIYMKTFKELFQKYIVCQIHRECFEKICFYISNKELKYLSTIKFVYD